MLREFKVFDTFAGIGGFTYGLEMAGGFDTAAFCEIDPAAQWWLRKLYPGREIYPDISSISGKNLTERHGKLDLITGGFPCQDISVAGKGKGIEEGERSGLVFKLIEVIDGARPDWLLLENSPQLRTRGYDRIHSELEGLGYSIWPFVVGARNAGAPHRRERVWIIGTNRLANAASNGRLIGKEFLVQQERECEAMGWLQLGQSFGLCGGGWSLADSHGSWEQQLQGMHREVGRRSDDGSEEGRGTVAHAGSEGSQESLRRGEASGAGSHSESARSGDGGGDGYVADTKGFRLQRLWSLWQQVTEVYARQAVSLRDSGRGRVQGWPARPGEAQHPWEDTRLVPHTLFEQSVGVSVDGLPRELVGSGRVKRPHKKVIEAQLKAMGNSIVPQIACALGMSIRVMDALITEQIELVQTT